MNLRYAQRVYRGFEWLGGELGTGSRINHGGILHTVRSRGLRGLNQISLRYCLWEISCTDENDLNFSPLFLSPDWIENKNAGMDIRWSLARLKTGSLASKLRFRSLNAKLAKLFHRSCPYRGGELSLLNSRTWIELNFHHASAHGI